MRWLLLFLGTLLVGLILGPFIQMIPGTVILVMDQYSIQVRFWQAVVMLIGGFLLIIFIYHLIARVFSTAGKFSQWSGSRKWFKARQKTIKGMIALTEGNWAQAEKLLTSAVQNTDTGLINYLAAARAAQAQNADDRRDNYLRLAHMAEPSAEVAVGLTQAQLQYRNGQYEEALASLTHLQQLAPNHGHVLLMLTRVYKKLSEWNQILEMLPALKKSKAISNEDYELLEVQAWLATLGKAAQSNGAEGLQNTWTKLPRKLRSNDELEYLYYQKLIETGASFEAEKGLTTRIKKDKADPFLELYGVLESKDSSRQLQFVEKLADKFQHSYIWLMTAGKLSLRQEIWGQAKSYFEQAVALKPTPESRQMLATAYDALGEHDLAYEQYKLAAALTH